MKLRVPLILSVLWAARAATAAEPFIERLWPPVMQRGQTARIEFSGSDLQQTFGLWTSIPGVDLTIKPADVAAADRVALDVTVPPNAPLGLYGLRLATPSGLSNVHLFLVDELPVVVASTDAAKSISLPACVVATVRKSQVDRYPFEVAAGQSLTFEVIGNRFGKNFDPVVTIRDIQGKFVARCDNSIGLMFDCRFAHKFAAAGRYFIDVADARYAGEPDWSYVLRVGEFPETRTVNPGAANSPANGEGRWEFRELRDAPNKLATWVPIALTKSPIVVEQEPNDSFDDATTAGSPLSLSGALCGVLDRPGDEDWFQFPLAKGQSLRVRSLTQAIGSAADLEVVLYEPSNEPAGREVTRNDETSVNDGRNTNFVQDANLTFGARADGLHRLLVRDLTGAGSASHTYVIEIGENLPEFKLAAEISALVVPRGTWQPLPIKITRNGYAGPIELELRGAPDGVTFDKPTIPADATEFVAKVMVANDAVEQLGTLQLIGRVAVNDREIEAVAATHPLIDRQLMNKDRIIYALRVDQRELPFSLTNRLALQITPPAPFDLLLADDKLDLPKYQTADLSLMMARAPGFESPIAFSVQGGQLGDEREERVQVYFRAPAATKDQLSVVGTFANRILTQYQQHRVDVTAAAEHDGRTVRLTRTFRIDIHPAFQPVFEPAQIEMTPGAKTSVMLLTKRVPTFNGEVQLTGTPPNGFTVPASLTLAPGQAEQPIEIAVQPNQPPGRYELRYEAAAYVGKFQELVRGPVLVVNVKAEKK